MGSSTAICFTIMIGTTRDCWHNTPTWLVMALLQFASDSCENKPQHWFAVSGTENYVLFFFLFFYSLSHSYFLTCVCHYYRHESLISYKSVFIFAFIWASSTWIILFVNVHQVEVSIYLALFTEQRISLGQIASKQQQCNYNMLIYSTRRGQYQILSMQSPKTGQ